MMNLRYLLSVQQALIHEEMEMNESKPQSRKNGRVTALVGAVGRKRFSKQRPFIVTCYGCKKQGHIRKNCPENKGGHAVKAAGLPDQDSDEMAFNVTDPNVVKSSKWLIDSVRRVTCRGTKI